MSRRREHPPVAARVPVSVTVPGRFAPVASVSLEPAGPPSRRPALVLLVLPVVLLVALAIRDHRRQVQHDEAHTAARLRIAVVSAEPSLNQPGLPGSLLQDGIAVLTLRNLSARQVRLLEARVDGAGPVFPGVDFALQPGHTAVLSVAWRVRCAEIGNTAGPRLLDLRIRLSSDRAYSVAVPLLAAVTDRAFRRAAVSACDVLVTR